MFCGVLLVGVVFVFVLLCACFCFCLCVSSICDVFGVVKKVVGVSSVRVFVCVCDFVAVGSKGIGCVRLLVVCLLFVVCLFV